MGDHLIKLAIIGNFEKNYSNNEKSRLWQAAFFMEESD